MELKTYHFQKNSSIKPKGLYLMLHGYGSNGEDLLSLCPELSRALPDYLFVSPNGIYNWEGGFSNTYQWYSLEDRSDDAIAIRSKTAFITLAQYVDELLKRYKLGYNKLIVSGFSQGGMLSIHATHWLRHKPQAIISHSGFLCPPALQAPLYNTKMLFTHGLEDVIVLPRASKIAADTLHGHGVTNIQTFFSPGLGHGIDYACIMRTCEYLESLTHKS